MSYLERLKAKISPTSQPSQLTKVTKAPSVTSVTTYGEDFSEINAPRAVVQREASELPADLVEANSEVDADTEARRQRVLAILAQHPDLRYAVVTDSDAEPGAVVVHIGIRGVASGEIVIAKANYDGIVLLKALEAAT